MNRQIIQITATSTPQGVRVFALANEGTLWTFGYGEPRWELVANIPQGPLGAT
jgi:hypothetical protein